MKTEGRSGERKGKKKETVKCYWWLEGRKRNEKTTEVREREKRETWKKEKKEERKQTCYRIKKERENIVRETSKGTNVGEKKGLCV